MRERSGSHGSRRNAPQAAHPGCLGGLAQVGRCRHPLPRYRPPPGYRCGRLRSKLPTTLVRTLATMRPALRYRPPPGCPAKARNSPLLDYRSYFTHPTMKGGFPVPNFRIAEHDLFDYNKGFLYRYNDQVSMQMPLYIWCAMVSVTGVLLTFRKQAS